MEIPANLVLSEVFKHHAVNTDCSADKLLMDEGARVVKCIQVHRSS